MDASRFDRVARQFAGRRISRRRALTTGAAGFAATVSAAAGLATGSALDATPDAVTEDSAAAPAMLFVQSFQSGSITPVDGVDGRYTLTLEQGHGQTVYFSDRPDRIVGVTDTPRFLEGLGFLDDNPPNAALVIETAPGETDVAVVELFHPLYDPVSQGVTYEVEVLGNWQAELGVALHEAPTDLAALAPSFGSAQLFIDDCPNLDIWCIGYVPADPHNPLSYGNRRAVNFGTVSPNADMCWNYSLCQPCEPYGHTYPDHCAAFRYWRDACNVQFNFCGGGGESGCDPQWHWYMPNC